MRIALLTDGITPYVTGGMQRHSYHLARHLLLLGADLTLVHAIPLGQKHPDEDEVRKLLGGGKLRVISLPFPTRKPSIIHGDTLPGHYIRESYKYACAVYESLEKEWSDFDFIYAKGFTAWRLLELKKKGEHMAPVGVKFHGYEMFQKGHGLKDRLIQFMFRPAVVFNNREANLVFSYGGEITEIIKRTGVEEEHIVEIGSGVDDSWISAEPKVQLGVRKFLFLGRVERRKGIGDLMQCKSFIAKLPIEFHWIGPIPKSKQLHLPNCIYHGEVKDPATLMALIDQCQVLVAPSHAEGMPNAILEAMCRGLAVISTEVGAVPMLVTELNGVRIKPGDIRALKAELSRFAIMAEAELNTMRKSSIDAINQNFRWSQVAAQTLKAIRQRTYGSRE